MKDCIIISGANRGLGRELASHFRKLNYDLILIARDRNKLKETIDFLKKIESDNKIFFYKCDISKKTDTDRFIKSILKLKLRIRFLINNASVFGPIERFNDVNIKKWQNTFNVNLFGTAYFIQSLLPLFKKNKNKKKIINIVGGGASKPFPFLSSYATSKAALIRLTEELAEEFKDYNIDINSVAPGPLKTRFIDIVLSEGKKKLGTSFYNQIHDIKKSGGTPFLLTCLLCEFLISNSSNDITGKYLSSRFDSLKFIKKNKNKIISNESLFTMRRINF